MIKSHLFAQMSCTCARASNGRWLGGSRCRTLTVKACVLHYHWYAQYQCEGKGTFTHGICSAGFADWSSSATPRHNEAGVRPPLVGGGCPGCRRTNDGCVRRWQCAQRGLGRDRGRGRDEHGAWLGNAQASVRSQHRTCPRLLVPSASVPFLTAPLAWIVTPHAGERKILRRRRRF